MDGIDQTMNTMAIGHETNIHSHIECNNDMVSHKFWTVTTLGQTPRENPDNFHGSYFYFSSLEINTQN